MRFLIRWLTNYWFIDFLIEWLVDWTIHLLSDQYFYSGIEERETTFPLLLNSNYRAFSILICIRYVNMFLFVE